MEGGYFCDDFWMEANGGGNDMSGWGMSRASKRAKEHKKRTSDVEDMAETRNQPKQFLN